MIRDQRTNTISPGHEDTISPNHDSSTSLISQSTSGPTSTRSKIVRPNSTPQLRMAPSPSQTPPKTNPPSTDDNLDSPESFRTPESPPSPAPPSPASAASTTSSIQLSPTSSLRPRDHSNLNLNKPLPVPPPPSRPPSSYGHATAPPPAYATFDPHALLFTIVFPYIYASSGDGEASPSPSSTSTPRYQLSTSQTRAGRPYQLALRRLTRNESRRVALTMMETQEPPAATDSHIPFDADLTLYTATYYSPRAAVPEMRGCKASTVAGRLLPNGKFPSASAGGSRGGLGRQKSIRSGGKSKGRDPRWEVCRLTRERNEGSGGGLGSGQKEIGTMWGYKDKDAWRSEVVFAVTEKEMDTRRGAAAGGEVADEEEVCRLRRKRSLGRSLRRGLGKTATATARSNEADWTREHRQGDGSEQHNAASEQTRPRKHHHRVFEWRAGSVSLSSTTTNTPHPTPILPNQLLATSGATSTTHSRPFNPPTHAVTAPASTLHRRPSTALRRAAPSCSTLSTAPTSTSSPSATCCSSAARRAAPGTCCRKPTRGGEVLRVREETRRWLRLEKPLERRALDALVAAWVVGVWMEGEATLL